MAKELENKMATRSNFADRLSTALEASKQTVTDLNEALHAKSKSRQETPTEAAPAPACPTEGKSA